LSDANKSLLIESPKLAPFLTEALFLDPGHPRNEGVLDQDDATKAVRSSANASDGLRKR